MHLNEKSATIEIQKNEEEKLRSCILLEQITNYTIALLQQELHKAGLFESNGNYSKRCRV